MDEGEEVAGGFLIAGGQSTEAFESMEEMLDQVAKRVQLSVLGESSRPVHLGADDGPHAEHPDQVAEPVRVVPTVADDGLTDGVEEQLVGLGHLVALARGQLDVSGPPLEVDESMNFCRKTSSRVSQSIVLSPPFPPAASRSARTMLPSRMEASGRGTGGSGSSCTSLKSRSQMPRFDQLLKRLYTDFHRPYRRGKSRHGQPVRVSQYTALMNRRSPLS